MQGVAGPQLYVLKARVQPPTGGVRTGPGILPFEPPVLQLGDVLALHMQHIIIKGIGLSQEEVTTPLSWADVPREDSGMERIPVAKVLFFCDDIKASGAHNDALGVMAFIVCTA